MKIDLALLQQQKLSLLHIIDTLGTKSQLKQDMEGILNLLDAAQDEQEDKFPNGLSNWIETHHEIVKEVERMLNQSQDTWSKRLYDAQANGGTGGIWMLCEELTDKFEQENKGV
jgi:hypothetical protein